MPVSVLHGPLTDTSIAVERPEKLSCSLEF